MSISYPLDILADFPGWTISFDLVRRQEQSRTTGGRTIVKDLGPPLWRLKAQSKPLRPSLLDYWRARLNAAEDGFKTLLGVPRKYPIAYPRGSWPTGGAFNGQAALASISTDRRSIAVSGLPNGFRLSIGDYVSFGNDLHQVMEPATAIAGTTPLFEVQPHLWPAATAGQAALVMRPYCIMALVPGTMSADAALNGWGSVTFQAMEARS